MLTAFWITIQILQFLYHVYSLKKVECKTLLKNTSENRQNVPTQLLNSFISEIYFLIILNKF